MNKYFIFPIMPITNLGIFKLKFLLLLIFLYSGIYIEEIYSQVTESESASLILNIEPVADSVFVMINTLPEKYFGYNLNDTITIPVTSEITRISVFSKDFQDLTGDFIFDIPGHVYKLEFKMVPISSRNTHVNNVLYPLKHWGSNIILATDINTEIYFENNKLGTGLGQINLSEGIYDITLINDGLKKISRIQVNDGEFLFVENYFLPTRSRAARLSFTPGLSQIYKNEHLKGYSIIGGITLSTSLSVFAHLKYKDHERKFFEYERQYLAASNPGQALYLADLAQSESDKANLFYSVRNYSLLTTLLIYGYNLFDARQEPKNGFANEIRFNPFTDFHINLDSTEIKFLYNF